MKAILINCVTIIVLTLTVITISAKTPKDFQKKVDTFASQAQVISSEMSIITESSNASSVKPSDNKSEEVTSEKSETTESDETTTSAETTSSTVTTTIAKTTSKINSTTKKVAPAPVSGVTTKNGITYVNGILVVNKTYPLPSSYNPGVDSTAQAALNRMFSAAKSQGISLWIVSGFRSYSLQSQLYSNYAAQDGKAAADRYSARPGHSEHQTGLAFDLNSLSQSFENTPEGQWLAKNCYKYGFIIRFPKGKESKTGYMYEPWHVRYLGVDTATKVYNSGLCLEEYLGITSTYNY